MAKKITFDKYDIRARIAPAIITIVLPVFVFSHFYINPELSKFYDGFQKFALGSDIAISSIIMFYLSQYARIIGKNVFEKKYFIGELNMPTTQFLLYSNSEYSDDYKIKIAQKISKDFGLILNDKQQELSDEQNSRRKIVEAMSHIRKKLFSNKFLLKHNIEYGAMRNAIGGSVIGGIISIFNVIFFEIVKYNKLALIISAGLLALFIFLIAISKWIISGYGRAYAKILIREYMGVTTRVAKKVS